MLKKITTLLLLLITSLSISAQAAEDGVYTPRFSNLALDGHDAVAYFTEGTPVKGSKDFTFEYNGATWQFASQANKDRFIQNPAKYAPQYGGYCAWAVSQNYTARGNPKNWKIVGGKLYLNYNDKIQARWEEDIPGFIAKADTNWPGVLTN